MKLLTIIPAKLDSKRLKRKNIKELNGKPLLFYSIEYPQNTKYPNDIIVSSESMDVKNILQKNILFHNRSKDLCGDVEVVDVYLEILKTIDEEYDYVICLQPDNPNRSNTLDECLDYMIENNYDDLITVNDTYKRSGSVRIFKYEHLKRGFISKRMGCIRDGATDIHYQSDFENVKGKL